MDKKTTLLRLCAVAISTLVIVGCTSTPNNAGQYKPYFKQAVIDSTNSSKSPTKRTTSKTESASLGPVPKTASSYVVQDKMIEHDNKSIGTTKRVQVTILLPGEK